MSDSLENRYFFEDSKLDIDPISGEKPIKLKYHAGGQWIRSKTAKYMPCYNPSTGAVIAYAPQCTADEVEQAIQAAANAFPAWSDTPVSKRVQVLFNLKALMDKHLEELTYLLAREMGKKWDEAMGDVLKVTEVVEFACGAPHIMKGEALMNVSTGYDTTRYNHPIGVFAGIAPWNFPAMIPQGWMAPICIAAGNCMVFKAASFVPQSAMRITEFWQEAGLPPGVLNVITAGRNEAEILLRHPEIKGVSFVGSTSVGLHIYSTAAANGKRVQALTEAKNHALVLRDCKLDRTAQGIINAFCGCAGERCMALPVVVVENAIADPLVALLKKYASEMKIGPPTISPRTWARWSTRGTKNSFSTGSRRASRKARNWFSTDATRRSRRALKKAFTLDPRFSTMSRKICPSAARKFSARGLHQTGGRI